MKIIGNWKGTPLISDDRGKRGGKARGRKGREDKMARKKPEETSCAMPGEKKKKTREKKNDKRLNVKKPKKKEEDPAPSGGKKKKKIHKKKKASRGEDEVSDHAQGQSFYLFPPEGGKIGGYKSSLEKPKDLPLLLKRIPARKRQKGKVTFRKKKESHSQKRKSSRGKPTGPGPVVKTRDYFLQRGGKSASNHAGEEKKKQKKN